MELVAIIILSLSLSLSLSKLSMAKADSFVIAGLSGSGKSSLAALMASKEPSVEGFGFDNCLATRSVEHIPETTFPCIYDGDQRSVVDTQGLDIKTPGKYAIDVFMFNKVHSANAVVLVFREDYEYKEVTRTIQDFLLYFHWLPIGRVFFIITHIEDVHVDKMFVYNYWLAKSLDIWYKVKEMPPIMYVNVKGNATEQSERINQHLEDQKTRFYGVFAFPATEKYMYELSDNGFAFVAMIVASTLGGIILFACVSFFCRFYICRRKPTNTNIAV